MSAAKLASSTVPALGSYTFTIPNDPSDLMDKISLLRKGGSFRIESDLPLHAVQHAPLAEAGSNDASCLVPENALGKEYVLGAYNAFAEFPSYLDVIATSDAQVTVKYGAPGAMALRSIAP